MSFDATLRTAVNADFPHINSLPCWSEYTENGTMTVTSSDPGATPFPTEISVWETNGAINAYGIVVKFQESDFSGTTWPAANGSSEGGGPTASPPGTTELASKNGGLNAGASVGIGVSVGLFALAAIVGGVYFLLRSRKRKRAKGQLGVEAYRPQGQHPSEWKPVGVAVYEQTQSTPQELGTTVHHMPGSRHAPQELGS
jgi:hypothetical protein